MRLVCPNCDAKYEVPDDAIPDTGRDVQCANCSHAWFQMRPRPGLVAVDTAPVAPPVAQEPTPAPEPAPSVQTPPVEEPPVEEPAAPEPPVEVPDVQEPTVEEPEPGPAEAPVEVPTAEPEDVLRAELDDTAEPDEEVQAAPVTEIAAAPAYKVDDSVLAILREEAEREAQARRAETSFPETQPDLGIESVAAPAPTPVVEAPVAAVAAAAPPVPEEAKPSARRDLLPDVEEINSSLRPADHPQDDDASVDDMPPPEPRGGFRSGFLLVMTVAMIASGLYIAAPTLARLVPALEGPLDSYVALINSLRLQLDGVMRQATLALNGG